MHKIIYTAYLIEWSLKYTYMCVYVPTCTHIGTSTWLYRKCGNIFVFIEIVNMCYMSLKLLLCSSYIWKYGVDDNDDTETPAGTEFNIYKGAHTCIEPGYKKKNIIFFELK